MHATGHRCAWLAAPPRAAAVRPARPSPPLRPRRRSTIAPTAGLNNAAGNGAAAAARARRSTPAPRLAIPSKGRMAEDTLQLLRDCQLKVYKPNPRQYTATIPQLPGVEVWFQRASDVVRKLVYGDVDLGIVG